MKTHLPRIAIGLGLILVLLLSRFSPAIATGGPALPLLTALLMAEFGFLLCLGAGVMTALRIRREGLAWPLLGQTLLNLTLAALLMAFGLHAWGQMSAAPGTA